MKSHLECLRQAEAMADWVEAWDDRLVALTGEDKPNSGCNMRDDWLFTDGEQIEIARHVARLLLEPPTIGSPGIELVETSSIHRGVRSIVSFEFRDLARLQESLSITRAKPTLAEPFKMWSGVALCGEIGLGVIAAEGGFFSNRSPAMAEARIQPVPQDLFERLVELG